MIKKFVVEKIMDTILLDVSNCYLKSDGDYMASFKNNDEHFICVINNNFNKSFTIYQSNLDNSNEEIQRFLLVNSNIKEIQREEFIEVYKNINPL